jgi:hypothetical protein
VRRPWSTSRSGSAGETTTPTGACGNGTDVLASSILRLANQSQGRESKWDIGFGAANPKDMVMEVALQDNFERPSLIYST